MAGVGARTFPLSTSLRGPRIPWAVRARSSRNTSRNKTLRGTFQDGSAGPRSFPFSCDPGTQHSWAMTAQLDGLGQGLGTTAGTFVC